MEAMEYEGNDEACTQETKKVLKGILGIESKTFGEFLPTHVTWLGQVWSKCLALVPYTALGLCPILPHPLRSTITAPNYHGQHEPLRWGANAARSRPDT